MNSNMFMALATAVLNASVLFIAPSIETPGARDMLIALGGLGSPFLAIVLLKLYIKIDDPPELVRQISSLKASIRVCQKHLKQKDSSKEFCDQTRRTMEQLQYRLQNARADFEAKRVHISTPISTPDQNLE